MRLEMQNRFGQKYLAAAFNDEGKAMITARDGSDVIKLRTTTRQT